MKTTMLDLLNEYFENNSKEKILADWKAVEKYSKVGPPMEEFLEKSKKALEEIERKVKWSESENKQQFDKKSSEYSSNFFYICTTNFIHHEKSRIFIR